MANKIKSGVTLTSNTQSWLPRKRVKKNAVDGGDPNIKIYMLQKQKKMPELQTTGIRFTQDVALEERVGAIWFG